MRIDRRRLKRTLAGFLSSSLAKRFFRFLVVGRLAIVTLHRLRDPELGIRGHPRELVREALAFLRENGVPVFSLREVVEALHREESLTGVVFTIDDGYRDFHRDLAPLFREFRCPVTVFVTTGFLDRRFWFWWDQLSYALSSTELSEVGLPWSGRSVPLNSTRNRDLVHRQFVKYVKSFPEDRRGEEIERLLEVFQIDIPDDPPSRYAPMTWEEVRWQAMHGVDFGPHSVTHPSMASSETVRVFKEVRDSFARLREELEDPLPVFCYPYGLTGDVSQEAAEMVREVGLSGAVTAEAGYVTGGRRDGRTNLFLLPRFGFPDRLTEIQQIVFGAERLKEILRGS